MMKQLRICRICVAALAVAGVASGCVTDATSARSELSTQQTLIMVRAGQFAALDRYYAAVQAAYDKGAISDERLRSAFRHFYDASPDLATRYAAWVKEMPSSYVAHLARAIYYVRVGEASRGGGFISETSEVQLDGMDTAFAMSAEELKTSLSLERRPLLSVFYQLDIGKFEGDAAYNHELLQASLAIDPKNFIVRDMYEQTLQTAWGGSTDEIEAFVAQSRTAGLSATQMKDLEAGVYTDEAWIDQFRNKNYKRAAAEYLEAGKISGDQGCLLCAGNMLEKAGDFPGALALLTQYLAQNPKSPEALALRGSVYVKLGREADAARDYTNAADLGDAHSEYSLGTMYLIGEFGIPQDRQMGIQWLQRAAVQGDQDAKRLLPIALNYRITILPSPQ